MVTIKDIAKKLNLSYATVSLALNASPLVRKETARKVRETADRMGYQPNAIARGLVLQRSAIIGIIVPDVSNPFFAALARGAEEAAVEGGFNLLICNTEWDNDLESRHLRLVQERKVDGLVIVSVNYKNKVLETLIEQKQPLVFASSSYPNAKLSFVGVDSEKGGYLAGSHLVELGHRKICFVGGRFNSESVQSRYRGFQQALKENGIDYNDSSTMVGDFSIESGYYNAMKLIKIGLPVTAAFAADDLIAIGMIKAFKERGIEIPARFSIVGYDDIFISALPGIELTTVFQEKRLMGKLAAGLLIEILTEEAEAANVESRKIILPPKLMVRKTTGPVPTSPT
jgi:LacI family transcriptional regulator